MPFVLLLLLAVCWALPVAAAVYRHPALGVALKVPPNWRVKEGAPGVLRVLPPRQEDRERGGVQVQIARQVLRGKDPLPALSRRLQRADGARESARIVRLDRKSGRLVVSYREGQYVQNGLWIVTQRLVVWQQQSRAGYIKAQCAANAAEYGRYRQLFADLCAGMTVYDKPDGGAK